MTSDQIRDRKLFESAIRALEAEIANVGIHLTVDSAVRQAYKKQIRAMSLKLKMMASSGKISWAQAAQQANKTRNLIRQVTRTRSTPVGSAIARSIKSQGRTLNELVAKKSQQLYGRKITFSELTAKQQNKVYSEIVKVAGKSKVEITVAMRKLSYAGKGLLFLSIALSVYRVATAEDKLDAAGKEAAVTGAGIGGGIAGGAIAGLACGPGSPVCVAVGAFIGGAVAAFSVDFTW